MTASQLVAGASIEWAAWAGWCLTAACVSSAITFVVSTVADSLSLLDRPNERSSHVRPTPRGGGIGIVAVGGLAVLVLWLVGIGGPPGKAWLFGAALGIAAVSGLDDVTTVSHHLRLAVHVAAAAVAAIAMGPFRTVDLGDFGMVNLGLAAWPLSIVWIVGMTNAFNFMDGIDGIAGLTAVVAMGVVACGFALAGEPYAAALAASLSAAACGFLVWNWHPARIFMGDVGSAFLGFLIAALPLLGSGPTRAWLLPAVVLVMWPFLFDTLFTLLRRLGKGENVFEAHRSHLYQRLVIAGWSHRTVALLYGGMGCLAGTAALAARVLPTSSRPLELSAMACVIVGAAALLLLVQGSEARLGCHTAS